MKKHSFKYLLSLSKREPKTIDSVYEEGKSIIATVINSQKIYVPLRQVDTILSDRPVTPIGYTKDWFAGVVRSGTNFVSVLDLANFPHKPKKKEKAEVLICLTEENINGHYGLLVSRIEETLTVVELPQRVEAEDTLYTLAYRLGDETIQVLSLTKIAGSQPFADISSF